MAHAPIEPLKLSTALDVDYHNSALASVNDHEIRISVMTSGFGWHHHPDSDETFLVLDGELVIEFEDHKATLGPGQMLSVPKGRIHRTRPAGARSVNLTFERKDAATVFRDSE